MENNTICVYFLLCIASTCVIWNGVLSCTEGIAAPGWIFPYEDQVIRVGSPYTMFCLLNTTQTAIPNATSRDLGFFLNDEPVSTSKITILNETSIEYNEPNASLTVNGPHDRVSCKLNGKLLCLKHLTVGNEPELLTNLSCISKNWENLTCTWDEPPNPIDTTYFLSYVALVQVAQQVRAPVTRHTCPPEYSRPGSCTWPEAYYSKSPQLRFTMNISNVFGNRTQTFSTVNHYAIMLPKQMENVSVSNVTKNGGHVSWLIPANLQLFGGGLSFKVSYRPKANWNTANETVLDESNLEIVYETGDPRKRTALLKSLPFSNVPYEIQVYAKSNQSVNLWSEPASTGLKTLPDIPCKEPEVAIGGFQLSDSKLIVYWDPVPPECENGDDFHYQTTILEIENGTEVGSVDTTNSYAQFNHRNLSHEYSVSITSVNEVGSSTTEAKLWIPSQNNILSKPLEVIGIQHSAAHLLEVTWSLSKGSEQSETVPPYHTIFWCKRGTDHCNGKLERVHVPEDTLDYAYNITITDDDFIRNHRVFVASITGQNSSGMVESLCLFNGTDTIEDIQGLDVSDETSRGWTITWIPIECGERLIVNYRIYIFTEDESYNKTITLNNTDHSYKVTDASPLKNYTIQMSVLSRYGEGARSAPKKVLTKAEDWYTWLAVGVTLAVVVLCISAAIFGYRHCTILQKAKRMKAVLPWTTQSTVSVLSTEKQGDLYPVAPYRPTFMSYNQLDSIITTRSPLTSMSNLSDRSSLGSETSETCPGALDTPSSLIPDQPTPFCGSLEQEDNLFKKDTSEVPQPDASGLLHQSFVVLGDLHTTKLQPGYVALGQQQEKLIQHTEPSAFSKGYVTLGTQVLPHIEPTPSTESPKQVLPGYVQLGHLGLQQDTEFKDKTGNIIGVTDTEFAPVF